MFPPAVESGKGQTQPRRYRSARTPWFARVIVIALGALMFCGSWTSLILYRDEIEKIGCDMGAPWLYKAGAIALVIMGAAVFTYVTYLHRRAISRERDKLIASELETDEAAECCNYAVQEWRSTQEELKEEKARAADVAGVVREEIVKALAIVREGGNVREPEPLEALKRFSGDLPQTLQTKTLLKAPNPPMTLISNADEPSGETLQGFKQPSIMETSLYPVKPSDKTSSSKASKPSTNPPGHRRYEGEDDLERWTREDLVAKPGHNFQAKPLYERYVIWAEARGLTPVTMPIFGKLMPRLGFPKSKVDGFIKYTDVAIRQAPALRVVSAE
jgi:hypothetical protein